MQRREPRARAWSRCALSLDSTDVRHKILPPCVRTRDKRKEGIA